MSIPVIQGNQGGLNKDNEPVYVTGGDYLDAQNVRYLTSEGQTTGSHENVIGNEFAFDIGETLPQSKKYKVCGMATTSSTSTTGWEYFGNTIGGTGPTSQAFTSSPQPGGTDMVEDTANPGNIYMSSGYRIWYYDSVSNTWSIHSDVDTGIPVKSVSLAISPTGDLYCAYTKGYGSNGFIRLTVKKCTVSTNVWVSLTNTVTGLDGSTGYTNGDMNVSPAGFLDYSVDPDSCHPFYINGDLYVYVIGVYNDPSSSSPLYSNNYNFPRVFKYLSGVNWQDESSGVGVWISNQWGFPVYNGSSGDSYLMNGPVAVDPVNNKAYLPLIISLQDIPGNPGSGFAFRPYVAVFDPAAISLDELMDPTGIMWNNPGGRKVVITSVTTSSAARNQRVFPRVEVDSLGFVSFSMSFAGGAPLPSGQTAFVYRNTGAGSTTWTQLLSPTILPTSAAISSVRFSGGMMPITTDASNNLYIATRDASLNNRMTVMKYDVGTSTWSLLDFQGMSPTGGTATNYFTEILNIGSIIHLAHNESKPGGDFISVQRYVGGSSALFQTFDFFYVNGIQKGSITANSIASFISGLNSVWPASNYTVTTVVTTSPSGTNCVEFTIEPLDVSGGSSTIGFNYYVTTSGLYTISVIQDPIPPADAGYNKVIGSHNLLNDLFIISTPNDRNIISSNTYGSSIISVGTYGLEITIPSGSDMVTDGYVRLDNVFSDISLTGDHLVQIIQSTNFDIIVFVGYFPPSISAPDCTLTAVAVGYGEIGVAFRDENIDSYTPANPPWTYIRLLGSSTLELSTLKQADVISERNNRGVSIYWVDNYNRIRALYYYGAYVQDGAYNDVNPLNSYTRSNVFYQLNLQKGYAGVVISYGGQGIGRLLCGNYRYSVRFVTNEGVSTAWSILSQPFSVYPRESDPYKIEGGPSDLNSETSNIIDISWDGLENYDYMEIGYTRTIPSGSSSPSFLFSLEQIKVARIKLQSGVTSYTYEHTGDEINTENIIDGELGSIPFIIKRAKNLRSLDNRLVASNVSVYGNEQSLVDFFDSFRYSVEKKAIPIAGSLTPSTVPSQITQYSYSPTSYTNYKSFGLGEYQDPYNVFYHTGYMMNETYRFYGVVEFLDGSMSDAYYLFDVKIDTSNTSSDGKRLNGLSSFAINDGPLGACLNGNVYIPFVRVQMPSILPLIDGRRTQDVIKRVHIWRENVKKRTILANGIGILSVYNSTPAGQVAYFDSLAGAGFIQRHAGVIDTSGNTANIMPFTLFSDEPAGTGASTMRIGSAAIASGATPGNGQWYGAKQIPIIRYNFPDEKRDIITFYSPDFTCTDYRISEENLIDEIINYGHYDNYVTGHQGTSGNSTQHVFGSFFQNSAVAPVPYSLSTQYKNGAVVWVDDSGQAKLYNNTSSTSYDWYTKLVETQYGGGGGVIRYQGYPAGYIFITSAPVTQLNVGPKEYGCYNMSYSRNLSIQDQYGDFRFGIPTPTGAFYDIQNDTTQLGTPFATNAIDVFGGDTFTSKAVLKARYSESQAAGATTYFDYIGVGIEYYCQSFINHQLRYNADTNVPPTNYLWPSDFDNPTSSANYKEWFTFSSKEKQSYNLSYSDLNYVNVRAAYNPDIYYENLQPATIYYSEPKLQESLSDSYSYIRATNRKDLDITHGPINHHEIVNGELMTFQETSVQRQYFRTTSMIASPTSQIVLGDGGAVLPVKGATLSSYGLMNKWALTKGKSKGGNDVVYWFDSINRKIFRFGADGVVPISSRANVESFIDLYSNFSQMHDTPANDMGIHAIWDEMHSEALFTFRVRKQGINYNQAFGTTIGYDQGDVVYYTGNINIQNFDWHKTGEFYVSQDSSNTAIPFEIPPPTGQLNWLHIPHNNPKYYNEFTIAFSEEKDKFTTFYSFKPKIYLKYKNRYLSPRPIDEESRVYEHNYGVRCVWYPINTSDPINDPLALRDEAFIEGIINYNPEMVKTAEALSIDAYLDPNVSGIERVEVRTKDHNTFMLGSDFNYAETMFRSPIKNDTLGGTVSPDSDTSRPYGRWIAMKFVMDWGYLQSIRSFVMKVRERSRMYNR